LELILKLIFTFILGVVTCALGVYFTLDFSEEKLEYSISSPAQFGDVNYQNITLYNIGWNPAEKLDVFITHPIITFKNIKSDINLKPLSGLKNGIATFDRLRRDEAVILSIVYDGIPLVSDKIKITSNRSIAKPRDVNDKSIFMSYFAKISSIITTILSVLLMIVLLLNQWLNKKKLVN
jgi:hypothetical protein